MTYETDEYIINYNECDKEYINELIYYFEKEKNNIFNFFNIDKLKKKLVIKLYDELDKYALYRKYHLSESSVGNMAVDENNYYLHILSYKELIKRKGHTNKTIEDLFKLLMHEFTHVCHEDYGTLYKSLIWIREGIAIILSHQYDGVDKKLDNCSLNSLLEDDNRILYINYYTLIDYALNNYGVDYIKELVFNPEFAKEETPKIYSDYINLKIK